MKKDANGLEANCYAQKRRFKMDYNQIVKGATTNSFRGTHLKVFVNVMTCPEMYKYRYEELTDPLPEHVDDIPEGAQSVERLSVLDSVGIVLLNCFRVSTWRKERQDSDDRRYIGVDLDYPQMNPHWFWTVNGLSGVGHSIHVKLNALLDGAKREQNDNK